MIRFKKIIVINLFLLTILLNTKVFSDDKKDVQEILELIQKDLKTLEKAVYSETLNDNVNDSISSKSIDQNAEEVLTRHLLKLSEIEKQFQELTNKFEEVNFKIDKLSNRLSKVQADNQMRFQELENNSIISTDTNKKITSLPKEETKKVLPGSSEPQDLGSISYKDSETNLSVQQTQSIDTTGTIVSETFESEEKLLPDESPEKQYDFAISFLKVGDYETAELALREFVEKNPKHNLAGNAQYWYGETFRVRQLYQDAATAYLDGYQKYPKSSKAPVNLLKLGVMLVQIGEKTQGCSMILGVKDQYPKAQQSVIQKAEYEKKKFNCEKKS